ncbi:hypothetical protein OGM23_05690 [Dickeya fangzhongdai]|uniref:hypothetical protein n=1 Tax=Dickeya fangzhongdai TaxID=1778540 RepID=UPI002B2C2A89|nr:hypothetical protein OGM23_05690 [Dickeya fangzhongdai]
MQREKIDSYKREVLYRKAHGKVIFDKLKEKLSLLLPDEEDFIFLSLKETDEIILSVNDKSISIEDEQGFSSYSESLGYLNSNLKSCDYYLLLDEDWKYCGAVLLKSGFAISENFDFDKVTSDEIRLISFDLNEKVSLDYSNSVDNEPFECRFIRYD